MVSDLADQLSEYDDEILTSRFRELELQRRAIEAEMDHRTDQWPER